MNIENMTRKDFEKLPHRKWDEAIVCDNLIIIPANIHWFHVFKYNVQKYLSKHLKFIAEPEIYSIPGVHDSGWRTMDFVACEGNKPLCLLSGCSDVIHIDGIGGFGKDWLQKYGECPRKVDVAAWSMDCLLTSGLLRMWCNKKIYCDYALSSFSVYCVEKE